MTIQALPKYDLQELTHTMMAFIDESRDQIPGIFGTVKLLSQGRPLSPERIAAELQLTPDEVAALFQMGEKDQDGNLVGFGVSLVPTRHSYRFKGRQLYAWCAGDAIMFSIFLKSDAVIESPDPISGDMVRLIATPAGVQQLEPGTAVVAQPSATESLENVRAWFCDLTNFFTSVETASQYVSQHPGLVIIPVAEVFQVWNRVYDREPYQSLIAGL
jgi:alkylmercury lyase